MTKTQDTKRRRKRPRKDPTVRRFLALNPDTMRRLDALFGHDKEGRRKREIATYLIFNRAIDQATGKGVNFDAEPYCHYKRDAVRKLFKLIPVDNDNHSVETPIAGG